MTHVYRRIGLFVALLTALSLAGLGMAQGSAQQAGVEPHPAHIHEGTCSNLNPQPAYPLTDVSLGLSTGGTPEAGEMVGSGGAFPAETSVSTVNVSLDDLLAKPYAVNVHQSADQIDTYIACGDIGGVRHGADLAFGLASQNGWDYVGTVWLHDNGDGTTNVTLALVRNLISAAGMAGGTPAATTPVAPAPAASPPAPAASPAASQGQGQAQGQTEVTVELVDIAFKPNEFTIPANTDVKVTLKNSGAAPHNFSIDALKISQDVAPGATETVTINAAAGDYQYYCNVPGHKEAGMVGTVHVK